PSHPIPSPCLPNRPLQQATLQHTQKVAPAPEGEKGAAIAGLNASGGGSAGASQGAHAQDGNKPPVVDQATKS
ncbi:hypothetical protein PMIN04_012400, partial [Paraphaeosphaeria minitans]